ncbi:MAG: branched-chain amino acid ABC transporter permease, partial [Candidatus Puniceispirillaceae bacterium]
MTLTLILEQTFNGLQAGVTLFLVAAGLTLILGIMDFVFLAHGAQVMIGAYAAAAITQATGNFFIGLGLAIPITFASGYLLELLIIRHLYRRDHMEQVLATFGLILFFNEAIRVGFGPAALYSDLPPALSGFVEILPETPYPAYRLGVIAVGLICALAIHLFVSKTRIGAMVRAGANNPEMTAALGINIKILFRL